MPIDPEFQKNREKVGEEEGIAIWGLVEPPIKLGIRGTYVAIDWDICIGCAYVLRFVQSNCMIGWKLPITPSQRIRRSLPEN